MNIVNGGCADMLSLGFSHVCCRLCFIHQEVVEIIDCFGTDVSELFIAPIGMHIIFKQANIAVIGRSDPFFSSVFLNKLYMSF